MGHKTHPIGFRLGVIKGWQSRWFAGNAKDYSTQVLEDWKIREVIRKQYAEAGISRVEIERSTQDLTINVHTARPGIVIGRGGQRVDELRKAVEGAVGGKRVRLNVLEIRQPELDALPRRAQRRRSVGAPRDVPSRDPSGGDAVHAGRRKGNQGYGLWPPGRSGDRQE